MRQTTIPTPTDAPLAAQRRRRREEARGRRQPALTAVSTEPAAATSTPPPINTPQGLHAVATRRGWQRLTSFTGRVLASRRTREPHRAPLSSGPRMTIMTGASAHSEAVLAQYLTGAGSGTYSGTPFALGQGVGAPAGAPTADDTPCEAARHDHGIIDVSRHVSSVGRR